MQLCLLFHLPSLLLCAGCEWGGSRGFRLMVHSNGRKILRACTCTHVGWRKPQSQTMLLRDTPRISPRLPTPCRRTHITAPHTMHHFVTCRTFKPESACHDTEHLPIPYNGSCLSFSSHCIGSIWLISVRLNRAEPLSVMPRDALLEHWNSSARSHTLSLMLFTLPRHACSA